MKRKVVLAVILIVSHVAIFILGGIVSQHTMLKAFAVEEKKASAVVDLGLYSTYLYIALAIKAKQHEKALCVAELGASGWYDDLKECLADQNCRPTIEQKLRKDAPEVLGEAPLKFTYTATKDGIKSCEQSTADKPTKKKKTAAQ